MNSSPYLAPSSRAHNAPRLLIRAVTPEPLFSLRRRRALCIGFLLVWPAFYAASSAHGAPLQTSDDAPMTQRVGKNGSVPLTPGAKWFVEEGIANAQVEELGGALQVRGVSAGKLRIRVENSDGSVRRLDFRFVPLNGVATPNEAPSTAPSLALTTAFGKSPFLSGKQVAVPVSPATQQLISRRVQSQMTTSTTDVPVSQSSIGANLGGLSSVDSAPASGSPTLGVNPATAPAGFPNGGARVNPPAGFPNGVPNFGLALPSNSGTLTSPSDSTDTVPGALALPPLPSASPNASSTPRPSTPRPAAPRPAAPRPVPAPAPIGGQVVRPLPPANAGTAMAQSGSSSRTTRISPSLPQPSRSTKADVPYRITPRPAKGVPTTGARPGIEVNQGLARLISFPDNILSVFFSDPNVVDVRAINARTIAVTGVGAGNSTLAVFTSQYPNDALGRPNVYRVQTLGRNGASQSPSLSNDPQVIEAAITAALGDPRIRTSVVRVPNGSLAARLTGTVRNAAEVQGAATTAAFFVNPSQVINTLYAETTAPTIDAVLNGTASSNPQTALQDSLRLLTGNSSLELISLPGGLALKAQANSPEEAEAILRVLPSLNQPVLPFIVLRGQSTTQDPYYKSQALQGEDSILTERLQRVTGVTSVTAVRAASNSVAIYGTVASRAEYEAVKRYGTILAQSAQGGAQGAGGAMLRPTGVEPALPANDPAGGYLRTLGVQMFVRILNPAEATMRNVTVETNVVEISRTALRNLGATFGSASVTNETIANGVTTRTISPTFNNGTVSLGNGFGGQGGFGAIDPFRVQLNALASRGDARILASPNVSALEGMPAQITIGGERPVPSAVATTGATAQSVEFRRYGVIISMRPTVADDNTIFLQIRADITQPDRTFEINLNGALIPGETVRSIDTSLAVKPGDIIVMGGLLTNEKRLQTSKVPILSSLPLIGSLFTSKRYENNETELAIFMTPRISATPISPGGMEVGNRAPAFPTLPSRQESNGILFQNTTRAPG